MLGCIQPMSSPIMKRMFGLACAAARLTVPHTPMASTRVASDLLIGISFAALFAGAHRSIVMSTPTELAWRDSRPADEGAGEMRVVGVADVERDIDDLARRVLEHSPCGVETCTRDHGGERQAFPRQSALQGPGAEPYDLRDRADVRRTVSKQAGDDLLHETAEPPRAGAVRRMAGYHRGTSPRPLEPSRTCSTHSSPRVSLTKLKRSPGRSGAVSMSARSRRYSLERMWASSCVASCHISMYSAVS